MKRSYRIAFELLGPAFIAVVIYVTLGLAVSRDPIVVQGFFVFLAFAYVFSAIPSAIFTLIMEIAFARGLDGRSWRAVALASILGLVSGVAVALTFSNGFNNQRGTFTVFPGLGAITGAIVGLTIYKATKKAAEPGATDNPDDA